MNTTDNKVNYNSQCHAWASNSKERCAMCGNHPGEHSFPVTAQRDAALAALRDLADTILANGYAHVSLGWIEDKARTAIAAAESEGQ